MKRTLLDDLIQAYHTIPCVTYEDSFCTLCGYCKNKSMCKMIVNLINSMRKFY